MGGGRKKVGFGTSLLRLSLDCREMWFVYESVCGGNDLQILTRVPRVTRHTNICPLTRHFSVIVVSVCPRHCSYLSSASCALKALWHCIVVTDGTQYSGQEECINQFLVFPLLRRPVIALRTTEINIKQDRQFMCKVTMWK